MRVLAFLLLLIPAFCHPQPGRSLPTKKDNRIYLVGIDAASVLPEVRRLLFERDYSIKFHDDQAGIIETDVRTIDKGRVELIVRISARDSVLVISGKMNLTGWEGFDPVEMRGAPKSFIMKAWNELVAIARDLAEQTGAQVRYGRE